MKHNPLIESIIKVKLNTKGRYKIYNEEWLDVQELVGTRVSVFIEGKIVDFALSEVDKFNAITFVKAI
jgi:hypothetical protein